MRGLKDLVVGDFSKAEKKPEVATGSIIVSEVFVPETEEFGDVRDTMPTNQALNLDLGGGG